MQYKQTWKLVRKVVLQAFSYLAQHIGSQASHVFLHKTGNKPWKTKQHFCLHSLQNSMLYQTLDFHIIILTLLHTTVCLTKLLIHQTKQKRNTQFSQVANNLPFFIYKHTYTNITLFLVTCADYIGCYIQSGDKEEWGDPNRSQMVKRTVEIQNLK